MKVFYAAAAGAAMNANRNREMNSNYDGSGITWKDLMLFVCILGVLIVVLRIIFRLCRSRNDDEVADPEKPPLPPDETDHPDLPHDIPAYLNGKMVTGEKAAEIHRFAKDVMYPTEYCASNFDDFSRKFDSNSTPPPRPPFVLPSLSQDEREVEVVPRVVGGRLATADITGSPSSSDKDKDRDSLDVDLGDDDCDTQSARCDSPGNSGGETVRPLNPAYMAPGDPLAPVMATSNGGRISSGRMAPGSASSHRGSVVETYPPNQVVMIDAQRDKNQSESMTA